MQERIKNPTIQRQNLKKDHRRYFELIVRLEKLCGRDRASLGEYVAAEYL